MSNHGWGLWQRSRPRNWHPLLNLNNKNRLLTANEPRQWQLTVDVGVFRRIIGKLFNSMTETMWLGHTIANPPPKDYLDISCNLGNHVLIKYSEKSSLSWLRPSKMDTDSRQTNKYQSAVNKNNLITAPIPAYLSTSSNNWGLLVCHTRRLWLGCELNSHGNSTAHGMGHERCTAWWDTPWLSTKFPVNLFSDNI